MNSIPWLTSRLTRLVTESHQRGVSSELESCFSDMSRATHLSARSLHHAIEMAFKCRGLEKQYRSWLEDPTQAAHLLEGLKQWGPVGGIPPPSLFKCRSLSTDEQKRWARELICGGVLYLASPLYLNDPVDCAPGIAPLTDGARCPFLENETATDVEELVRNSASVRGAVFSMSATPLSSPLWTFYADNHRGICVELKAAAMLLGIAEKKCQFRQVRYARNPVQVRLESEDAFGSSWTDALFEKSADWSFEKEWRVVKWLRDDEYGPSSPVRRCVIPDVVRRVWLGLRTPDGDAAEVASWCRSAGLELPKRILLNRTSGRLTLGADEDASFQAELHFPDFTSTEE